MNQSSNSRVFRKHLCETRICTNFFFWENRAFIAPLQSIFFDGGHLQTFLILYCSVHTQLLVNTLFLFPLVDVLDSKTAKNKLRFQVCQMTSIKKYALKWSDKCSIFPKKEISANY